MKSVGIKLALVLIFNGNLFAGSVGSLPEDEKRIINGVLKLNGKRLTNLQGLNDIVGIANVKTLNLADNRLHALPLEVFDQMVSLEKLNLKSNELQRVPTRVIERLARLRELNLSDNYLTERTVTSMQEYCRNKGITVNLENQESAPGYGWGAGYAGVNEPFGFSHRVGVGVDPQTGEFQGLPEDFPGGESQAGPSAPSSAQPQTTIEESRHHRARQSLSPEQYRLWRRNYADADSFEVSRQLGLLAEGSQAEPSTPTPTQSQTTTEEIRQRRQAGRFEPVQSSSAQSSSAEQLGRITLQPNIPQEMYGGMSVEEQNQECSICLEKVKESAAGQAREPYANYMTKCFMDNLAKEAKDKKIPLDELLKNRITGHRFHSQCLTKWIRDSGKTECPVCRRNLKLTPPVSRTERTGYGYQPPVGQFGQPLYPRPSQAGEPHD